MDTTAARFNEWFKRHGTLHEAVGLTDFPGMGRGAVALHDIPSETVLFSIPRHLLLNTSTSTLPSLLPEDDWKRLAGWTGLILCMMWEYTKGAEGRWHEYFEIMPNEFDSLMFWSDQELKELEGSSVVSKIGKEEAMQHYHELIKPLVHSRRDIFASPETYTEELYNRMGSLILSRSFHVEEGADDDEEEEQPEDEDGDESALNAGEAQDTSMAVSTASDGQGGESDGGETEEEGEDEDEDEDDEEDVAHVSMVPWADMLNARHGCDNARLFYEKECLNMCATKDIKKGEQIWNVYGDPPNSDLLRRYGHVDSHNPSDIVEVTADLVADVACKVPGSEREERVEFLLDAELDDTYTFSMGDNEEEYESLLQSIAVFAADKPGFARMQKKGKVSGKKGLKEDAEILKLAKRIFERRLSAYPWNFEEDERLLRSSGGLSNRHRSAITVRHGEMRILRQLISELQEKLPAEAAVDTMDISMEQDGDASSKPLDTLGGDEVQQRKVATAETGAGAGAGAGSEHEPEPALHATGRSRILSKKEQREERKRMREEEKLFGSGSDRKRRR